MERMRAAFLSLIAALYFAGPLPADPVDLSGKSARVAVPVADLRREPVPAGGGLDHDPLEESQLLYGDVVSVIEEKEGWARVSASQQLEWSHHKRWEGYPGWVERSALVEYTEAWEPNLVVRAKQAAVRAEPRPEGDLLLKLSIASRVQALPEESREGWWKVRLLDGSTGWIAPEEAILRETLEERRDSDPAATRAQFVETARLFLGDPYYWGGRSAHDPDRAGPPHGGVDCSGLVGLIYQANDSTIPRDAHEQWMSSRKITRDQLRPADLVFLADPEKPEQIGHVMFYVGEGRVIEGPGTGGTVRETDLESRLKENPQRRAEFGRYLP